MTRSGLFAALASATLLLACSDKPDPPPPCKPIPAPSDLPDLPDDTVWGFADLHAHPAIELAFEGHLIWGQAEDGAPVNGAELPRIAACPVETHARDATSPLDRAAGSKVFSALAQAEGFAHGPVGSASGSVLVDSWPNARDVIHQQMNLSSIRRAYEGGLRLMFASTTDDQLLGAILSGPNLVDGFVPRPEADYESARRQLDMIVRVANANATWMKIVHTPEEARRTIREGRLAVVLALEMNGLRHEDVDKLVEDFGVASVLPVHLIDNDIGGTAVTGDLFNASSAAASELYRTHVPHQYMSVVATPDYARTLGRPFTLGTFDPPIYVNNVEVPYPAYEQLCYEPLQACSGTEPKLSSFIEFGQKNRRGLCTKEECANETGQDRIEHLMKLGLLVDVSHMSEASLTDTMGLPARDAYPLIASHGDVARLCEHSPRPDCVDDAREPASERSIDADRARDLLKRGGVLGFGTALGAYGSRTLLAARGGPLFELSPAKGSIAACAVKASPDGQTAPGCETALQVDRASPGIPIPTLQIRTIGGVPAEESPARPVARIELRGQAPGSRYQRRVVIVPLGCSTEACSAQVDLGNRDEAVDPDPSLAPEESACAPRSCEPGASCGEAPYTLDDLESVSLEWLYVGCDFECQKHWPSSVNDRQCSSTWDDGRAPLWTIEEAEITVPATAAGMTDVKIAQLGPRGPSHIARLGRTRGSLALYRRDDRASAALDVPATGHLLKVSLTSGPDAKILAGASPTTFGTNVCVAVRKSDGAECPPVPPPAAGASECPDGWARLNRRGEWDPGVTLSTFVRFPGDESTVCGVDLAVLDWDPKDEQHYPLSIDEVRVEAIEDPVGRWVRRYAAIARNVADGRLGALAFGTDFNGLNGTTDISECPRPPDALAPSACGDQTTPLPLAPLRFRDADGELGGQVLIEERGLATYGLLADMLAVIGRTPGCGKDVRNSLMLSAEATIRAWEAIRPSEASKSRPPLPQADFACVSTGEACP